MMIRLHSIDSACVRERVCEGELTVVLALEHVLLDLEVQVLRAEVGGGHQNLRQVLLLKAQYSLCSRHCSFLLDILE